MSSDPTGMPWCMCVPPPMYKIVKKLEVIKQFKSQLIIKEGIYEDGDKKLLRERTGDMSDPV